MESMIDQVARTLNLDPDIVRKSNLYKKNQVNVLCNSQGKDERS